MQAFCIVYPRESNRVVYWGLMSEKRPVGRPPKLAGERRRIIGISMSPRAIADLRELAEIRGESQGVVIETLVARALRTALRKASE